MNDRSGFIVIAGYFSVYVGYGLAMPVLPDFLRGRLGLDADALTLHTGLVTATYPLAIAAIAPLWGWFISYRLGRAVYIAALVGYALSLIGFGMSKGLVAAYTARAAAGICGALISVAALSWAGRSNGSSTMQARRFILLAMAATAGLLAGPALGGWLAAIPMAMLESEMLAGGPLSWPFLAGAAFAAFTAIGAAGVHLPRPEAKAPAPLVLSRPAIAVLCLSLVGATLVGSFEVGLGLQRISSGIGAAMIGNLFGLCGLVMGVAQAGLYFAGPPREGRTWIVFGIAAAAVSMAMTAVPTDITVLAASTILLGLGGGLVLPLLPYYAARIAGESQGPLHGLQVGLMNLGQALGAAAMGWLLPMGPVIVWLLSGAAILIGLGAAASLPQTASLNREESGPTSL